MWLIVVWLRAVVVSCVLHRGIVNPPSSTRQPDVRAAARDRRSFHRRLANLRTARATIELQTALFTRSSSFLCCLTPAAYLARRELYFRTKPIRFHPVPSSRYTHSLVTAYHSTARCRLRQHLACSFHDSTTSFKTVISPLF